MLTQGTFSLSRAAIAARSSATLSEKVKASRSLSDSGHAYLTRPKEPLAAATTDAVASRAGPGSLTRAVGRGVRIAARRRRERHFTNSSATPSNQHG